MLTIGGHEYEHSVQSSSRQGPRISFALHGVMDIPLTVWSKQFQSIPFLDRRKLSLAFIRKRVGRCNKRRRACGRRSEQLIQTYELWL